MEIKRTVCLYFSPTGGTRKVVRAVAEGIGAADALELDRTSFDARWTGAALREGDFAVIGVPVYYGRVPRLMVEFFRYIEARSIPAALVAVYGNRDYEDALLELQNESVKHGFLPIAAGAFIGRHSYTDKMGTGRPDGSDLAKAAAFGRDVRALAERTADPRALTLTVKGGFPYHPAADLPFAPSTDREKCTGCMLCEKNCPVKAIDPLDPCEIDGWRCLDCAKCIQSCPTGAKYIGVPPLLEKIAVMEAMFAAPKQPELFLAE